MISSFSNETYKEFNKLKTKKYSKKYKKCVVESRKIVAELYERGLVETIFVTEDKLSLFKSYKNVKIEVVSSAIAEHMSESVTNDGVLAICKIPDNNNVQYNKCIVLDALQDPSNIGAIIRSAKAFGFTTIFALNSVYPYTFKGVRSSMGHIFGINYFEVKLDELIRLKDKYNIKFICADMQGKSIDKMAKLNDNFAIIIGNEGAGVSDEVSSLSDQIISIPMERGVESLNASVSAGIIMYYLK